MKLQQLQQQDPAASLDEMVQAATNTFYNRKQVRKAKAKEREKRRDKACPDAGCPPGKPYGKPRILEGQLQFSSVTQLCLILCNPMAWSTPGLPVHHQLPEFTQTQVH